MRSALAQIFGITIYKLKSGDFNSINSFFEKAVIKENASQVLFVDGTIRLSVMGEFFNKISQSVPIKNAYLCLKPEGAETEIGIFEILS